MYDKFFLINQMGPGKQVSEDAFPLFLNNKKTSVLSISDGLGASGKQKYQLNGKKYSINSGAYYSSYYVRKIMRKFVKNKILSVNNEKKIYIELNSISSYIRKELQNFYAQELSSIPTNKSASFFYTLPSTLTGLVNIENNKELVSFSFNAGDSLSFMIDNNLGIIPLSQSILQMNKPTSQVNNFINLTKKFNIKINKYVIKSPTIMVACSDGAYDWAPNSLYLEFLMLWTLSKAKSLTSWKRLLKEQLKERAKDDISFILVAYGFDNFRDIKEYYKNRFTRVNKFTSYIMNNKGKAVFLKKHNKLITKKRKSLQKIGGVCFDGDNR